MAKMTMAEKLAARVQPLAEDAAGESEPAEPTLTTPVPAPEVPAGENPSEPAPRDEPQPAVAPDPAKKQPASRTKRKAAEPRAQAPATTSEAVQIILELPKSLDDRLEAYRAKKKQSHTVVLFDAVETTYDRLPELIREALGESAAPATRLFERSARTLTPVRGDDDEVTVQHTIRTTLNNRTMLSDLAEQFGAPSRNFLLVTAYRAFLPEL